MDLITVTGDAASGVTLRVRGHELRLDMAPRDGGQDLGPSPAEVLAGSLGACVVMIVEQYCRRHGYTDGAVEASLTVEMADDPKRVGGIVVDLEVPRDVPPERIEAIRRLAEFCPVHQTLKNPPKLDLEVIVR